MVSTASRRGGGYRTGGYRNRVASARRYGMQELKFFDTTFQVNPVSTSWLNTVGVGLNMVRQGSDANQRIGRCIYIKSLFAKGIVEVSGIQSSTAETGAGNIFRIAIVLDTQCNGSAPVAGDIWQTGSGEPINDFRNLEKSSRFRILYDKLKIVNQDIGGTGTTDAITANRVMPFKISKKMNLKVEFDDSTGAIGDLTTNNLYLWVARLGGGAAALMKCKVRIRYDG